MNVKQIMELQRTPEETVRAYRAFMEECEPLRKQVAQVMAMLAPPRIVLDMGDGTLQVQPPEIPHELLAAYRECVRVAAHRHGFEVTP